MDNNFSPIALFVFNRYEKTKKTIISILLNQEAKFSELFVFSDGPKKEDDMKEIRKIRKLISQLKTFKKIHLFEREKNFGLANSIIKGVNEVLNHHKTVIVLEDDIIISRNFLYYMNKSLNEFILNHKIFSITGYSFSNDINTNDIYVFNRFMSWGWATWKDRWSKINFDYSIDDLPMLNENKEKINLAGEDLISMYLAQIEGRIDSWAVRFAVGQCLNQGLTIYPKYSLVKNIGFDNQATHTKRFNSIYLTRFHEDFCPSNFNFIENQKLNVELRKKFKMNLIRILKNYIKRIL